MIRLGTALLVLLALATPARAERAPLVGRIAFQGNRKVEEAAMRAALSSREGLPYSAARVAADVRSIWRMGYFEDVQVNLLISSRGLVLVYVVKEKPSVRKIVVAGNDEVELDKINEVLDLKREGILDVSQIKRNAEKIRDLYTEKGFYLADVTYRLRKVSKTQVDVLYDIRENAKVVIRRITFIGNRAASDDDLKAVMGTQEGGYFSFLTSSGTYQESAFERDLLLMTALYYDRGYINVKLATPRVTLSPDKRFMYITIHIEEGLQYRLGKLDIRGDLLWPRKELMADLTVRRGEIFNRTKLGKDVMALTDRYKDRGHAYVNITPLTSIDADKRIVDLTFDVQKGPVVIFERINIRGNSKTRDKVIRRELKVSEGDRYSQTLLNRSKARVTALGFFESVNVSTKRGTTDDRIVVTIEVKERPTGTFQVGAGFSSVENFIAQAQISQNNLFGRGQRLALQAQISGLRQLFSVSFWEPYFLDTQWTFGFDVYNSLRNFESFNRNATGGNLTWGYPITDDIRVYLTYTGEYVAVSTAGRGNIFGATTTSPLPAGVQLANLFNSGFTSSVRFSVQWDTRNNRLFPTKGFFHTIWAEFSTPVLGSQNVFNRYGGFTRWYYPIWGPFVFKFNGQIGVITSSDPKGVPIFERYFVGGIMDVRGFRPRSLGPRIPVLSSVDPNDSIFYFNKGGNKEMIFNAEIEFPIFEKVGIRGVIFSDAGMAFDDSEPLSFTALRHSAGFGFRWFSPIGPLRFEWGLPLRPQSGEDPLVFEFTIGNFF
ncbi:MAG: outer membrane protein assembly factor BamA [Deltaproteobacteria bacterium]|nr:outer membrane protein assembly factor BamA [Deltaproteobacteria bacterium]